jgi:hypothetical protein
MRDAFLAAQPPPSTSGVGEGSIEVTAASQQIHTGVSDGLRATAMLDLTADGLH